MALKRKTDVNEELEQALETQIPEAVDYVETPQPENTVEKKENSASQYLGKRIGHLPGQLPGQMQDMESTKNLAERKNLSRVGDNIFDRKEKAEIREGYIPVDRRLLGDRDKFYPVDWRFKIKPADVEAIKNWSTLNADSANSIDDVFNEILKWCLAIEDGAHNPLPWNRIYSWDRFFFVLLIREYTMKQGENKIEWVEDCINCDSSVTFNLNSQSLMYDMPDPEIMKYYSVETCSWFINPADFDVEYDEPIELFLPTLEKDANIKAWMFDKYQQNKNAKFDQVFLRFLPWLAKKISKDPKISARQIRELELKFKSWDVEMFSFMDNVLKNIIVTPSMEIKAVCPSCGEEVTSQIRFPDGVGSLFNMGNKFKKFGSK